MTPSARSLASGEELAPRWVNVDGETVVDIWGGLAGTGPRRLDEDTITNVWSTTKTITNLAALMLADRGELDVYAPVARTGRSSGPTASRASRSAT